MTALASAPRPDRARGSLILMPPPLIAQTEHIDEAVSKLDRVLGWADPVEPRAGRSSSKLPDLISVRRKASAL